MDGWGIATAIGTIAAALVPATLYLFERKDRKETQAALDRERRERLQDERDRARRTAEAEVRKVLVSSRVTRTVVMNRDENGDPIGDGSGTVTPRLEVHVVNWSSSVVFDVTGHADAPGASVDVASRLFPPALPAGGEFSGRLPVVADRSARAVVLEGKTAHHLDRTRDVGNLDDVLPEGWRDEVRHRVWVEFTDVAQQRWARYEDLAR